MENKQNQKSGLIGAGIGAVLAALLLFIGFWKTLLVLVFAGAGYWIGVNGLLKGGVKETINRVVPGKDDIHTKL